MLCACVFSFLDYASSCILYVTMYSQCSTRVCNRCTVLLKLQLCRFSHSYVSPSTPSCNHPFALFHSPLSIFASILKIFNSIFMISWLSTSFYYFLRDTNLVACIRLKRGTTQSHLSFAKWSAISGHLLTYYTCQIRAYDIVAFWCKLLVRRSVRFSREGEENTECKRCRNDPCKSKGRFTVHAERLSGVAPRRLHLAAWVCSRCTSAP